MRDQLQPVLALVSLRLRLLSRMGLKRYNRRALAAAPLRLIIASLLLFGVVSILVVPLINFIGSNTPQVSAPSALESRLTVLFSLFTVFIFFYAILSWVTRLTSAGDIRLLLLSPLEPRLVMTEKMVTSSVGFTLVALLTLPGIIALGNSLHLGTSYDLAAVAAILILPVVPVSLAMLLVLAIIRWLPPARVQTIATVVGVLIGGGLYIATQTLLGGLSSGGSSHDPSLPAYLPSTWPGRFLAATGIGDPATAAFYLVLSLALSILLAALAVELSARLFVTGSGSYAEVARTRAKHQLRLKKSTSFDGGGISTGQWNSPLQLVDTARPRWWPLFQKEWVTMRRDPQRLALLAYPLLVVGYLSYRSVSGLNAVASQGGGHQAGYFYFTLILASVLLTGSFAPTIVNREGRSLYLLALAPLSARAILASKWAISALPATIVTEALLAIGVVGLNLGVVGALVVAIALVLLAVALSGICLTLNLIWPKLSDLPRWQASVPAQMLGFTFEIIVGGAAWVFLALMLGVLSGSTATVVIGTLGLLSVLGVVILATALAGPPLLRNLLTSERARV